MPRSFSDALFHLIRESSLFMGMEMATLINYMFCSAVDLKHYLLDSLFGIIGKIVSKLISGLRLNLRHISKVLFFHNLIIQSKTFCIFTRILIWFTIL